MTEKNSRSGPAPSTMAASSSSRGMLETKDRNSKMEKESPKVTSIKIMPGMVLNRPRLCSTQMVGTTAGGTISPARTKKLATVFQRDWRRSQDVAGHGGRG